MSAQHDALIGLGEGVVLSGHGQDPDWLARYLSGLPWPLVVRKPPELQEALKQRAGIVESGLFLGLATVALIGTDQGVREMRP